MLPISAIRHDLHNHPGPSGEEWYAHNMVVSQLEACRCDKIYPKVGGFGVVALWGTDHSRPTVAIRCDIDALPIGHRCGHDGHTAILIQTARLLHELGTPADHNVLLIFQPEEETGKGAQKILNAGILQQYDIRAIYGLHNLPGYPLGTVVLNHHTFAAASTGVAYRLVGRPTHASTPEKGLNPGLAVAEMIEQFAALNSTADQSLEQFRQSTLICVNLGQEAYGTSAGEATVMFTLRAFTNKSMEKLLSQAHNLAYGIATKHHLSIQHTLQDPFPATENSPEHVLHIEAVCAAPCQTITAPFRWSEDFAVYLQHYPGAMFGIGAGEHHLELHHPDYDFPDELTLPSAHIFHRLALTPLIQTTNATNNN